MNEYGIRYAIDHFEEMVNGCEKGASYAICRQASDGSTPAVAVIIGVAEWAELCRAKAIAGV